MRITVRILLAVLVLVALLAVAGAGYQAWAARADRARFPPPGEMVEVDGLGLHLNCQGSGRPAVIMESGLTAGSLTWGSVPAAVAGDTEVCAYDRPGMDWSEPIGRVADAGEVADRLHRLLETAGVAGPYVLVGWSAGGVYVREFYHRHPDGVVGMVLVDSSHEQQGDRLPRFDAGQNVERMIGICSWLQPLGIVRLTGALDRVLDQPGITDAMEPALRASLNRSYYCSAVADEMHSFAHEVHDPAPPASLDDLPLVVLSQGDEPKGDAAYGITDEQARAQRVVWNELQDELTALSSRGTRLIARHSGHAIALQQPALLIDTLTHMVERLRNPASDPGR